jgi:alkylhydroperoxidase/carboxymuconolactone decarboxylase family protein YurZ
MARLPYLNPSDLAPENQDLLKRPINLYRVMSHNPDAQRAQSAVGSYIRFKTKLDPRLRELAILQVGYVSNSAYEWSHHAKIAQDFGATKEDIRAVAEETAGRDTHLEPLAKAVLRAAREIAQSGDLGEILYIDSARLNLGLYQPDVNVIWDLAPHDISIMNHLLQAIPSHVQAWGGRHAHPRLEDVAHVHLEYADIQTSANVHVSWLDPCKVRRTTVVGDRQMLVYDDGNETERVRVYAKGVVAGAIDLTTNGRTPMSYRVGDIRSPYIEFHEPLACQDQHFVNCVISGTRPATDGEAGRRVVAVLEAAQISLEQKRRVALDEVMFRAAPPLAMTVGS